MDCDSPGYARISVLILQQGVCPVSEKKKADAYTELFLAFSDQVELWIKRGIIALVLLLLLSQAALSVPALRHVMASADRHEGVPIQRIGTH